MCFGCAESVEDRDCAPGRPGKRLKTGFTPFGPLLWLSLHVDYGLALVELANKPFSSGLRGRCDRKPQSRLLKLISSREADPCQQLAASIRSLLKKIPQRHNAMSLPQSNVLS